MLDRRLKSLWHALALAREGSPAIEFALAFPVVIGLTMGVVEVSYIAFAESTLEGAVRDASRRGVTGFTPEGNSREEFVKGRIIEMMGSFTLHGPVDIETLVYDSFGDINEPEPFTDENGNGSYDAGECFSDINENGVWDADMAESGLGGAGSVVVYTARVEIELLTPAFQWLTGSGDGLIELAASTAVRNEPFNLSQGEESGNAPEICGS